MTAPIGALVKLYIDTRRDVAEGDVIQTQTARSYRVLDVRRQEKGKHAGRWHLQALVIDPTSVNDDDHVIPIRWYRR